MHAEGKLSFRRRVRDPIAERIPFVDGTSAPVVWDRILPAGAATVEIEVGPGKGTFLKAACAARPDVFFVGVEASQPYARYAADRLARAGHENGVLVADNARMFLRDRVPAAAVAAIHVYYPDPWPKRRHRRRRFFQPDAGDILAGALRPDGLLLVATDSTAYFGEIVAVLGGCAALRRDAAAEARYGDGIDGVAFRPTNFQRRFADQGKALHRSAWRRVQDGGAWRPNLDTSAHRTGAHGGPGDRDATEPRLITSHTEQWQPLARLDELPETEGRAFQVADREIALFRANGQVYAIDNACPHRGAALAEGVVDGGQVSCPWHGWRFDLQSGECRTIPEETTRIYATRVVDGMVEVRVPVASQPTT